VPQIDFSEILIFFPIFLFSLSFHEAAHAWTAEKFGDPTGRQMGRITLNPLAHIDPIGTIMFPLLGLITGGKVMMFGWAKPVPVNTMNMSDQRMGDIWVSMAGPLSNGILLVIFFFLAKFLFYTPIVDIHALGDIESPVRAMIETGLTLNVVLMIFNLLPIPPLDGSHVLRNLLSGSAAEMYERIEGYGWILLLLLVFSGVTGMIVRPVIRIIGMLLYL
jgi:Zn-dependent protease